MSLLAKVKLFILAWIEKNIVADYPYEGKM